MVKELSRQITFIVLVYICVCSSAEAQPGNSKLEILDSMTNERIAAAIDTRPGGKIEGCTKWGAVKGAFEFWAKRLRLWLDETHGRE